MTAAKFNLPRRQWTPGLVHFAAPNGKPGALCGADGFGDGEEPRRPHVAVTCGRCQEIAEWVWSHRKGYGFGGEGHRMKQRRRRAQSGD